jgi:hypothetical protein
MGTIYPTESFIYLYVQRGTECHLVKNEGTKKRYKEEKPPTPNYFSEARDLVFKRGSDTNCINKITFRPEDIHTLPLSHVDQKIEPTTQSVTTSFP